MNDVGSAFSSSHAWPKWLMVSAALIALDQVLKVWVSIATPLGFSYEVTSFFNIVHARNPGAAFSFLAAAGGWQRWFFLGIAIAVSLYLGWMIRRGVTSRGETTAYVAILGGALGNAFDRARLGFVVDFLDVHWKGSHWPAFNLADAYITTGAILLLATAFLQSRAEKRVA